MAFPSPPRAPLSESQPRLTPHPPLQIAESFRRFGITPTTTSLLLLKLSTPTAPVLASAVQAHLAAAVAGENVPLTDESLAAGTDLGRVRKVYKLNAGGGKAGKRKGAGDGDGDGSGRDEQGRRELEIAVLGAMALRGVTN